MLLSTVILLLLLVSIIHGYRNGLLSMAISVLTMLIGYWGAKILAPAVGDWLTNFLPEINHGTTFSGEIIASLNLNQFFYRGIAFTIGFIFLTIIIRLVLRRMKWLRKLPIFGTLDRWGGAVLNLIICYVLIFVLLMVFQLCPVGWWQLQLANSEIAQLIIKQTPFLTQMFINFLG